MYGCYNIAMKMVNRVIKLKISLKITHVNIYMLFNSIKECTSTTKYPESWLLFPLAHATTNIQTYILKQIQLLLHINNNMFDHKQMVHWLVTLFCTKNITQFLVISKWCCLLDVHSKIRNFLNKSYTFHYI